MSSAVLDSSAVLALRFDEPGGDKVRTALPGALLGTVNLAEVLTKLVERGMEVDRARRAVDGLHASLVPFDDRQAAAVARLRTATRSAGLSFGDRACLALAIERDVPALTADRSWIGLPTGARVDVIR